MALNPRIGHLYHDHNISNKYTVLDAKEHLRIREVNVREARNLDRYSHILDRAKNICRRRIEWEQNEVRRQLDHLLSKTASLSDGLREESERIKRHEDYRKFLLGKSAPASRTSKTPSHASRSGLFSKWSVYSQCQEQFGYPWQPEKPEKDHHLPVNSKEARLNRRAEEITRTLHKLYTRNVQRKCSDGNSFLIEVLENESNVELKKALRSLKGTPAGHLIEAVLKGRDDADWLDPMMSLETNQSPQHVRRTDSGRQESRDDLIQSKQSFYSASSRFNNETPPPPLYQSDVEKLDHNIARENAKRADNDMKDDSKGYSEPVLDVFKKDDPREMSSLLVNPSESDWKPKRLNLSELFMKPTDVHVEGKMNNTGKDKTRKSVFSSSPTGKHTRLLVRRKEQ